MDSIDTSIDAFYDALTEPATKDVPGLLTAALAEGWRSYASSDDPGKTREAFIAQVGGFGRAFVSLEWSVQEVIRTDSKVVVRSRVTGVPAGEFMGAPHGGGSFPIMTIDIHTIEGGELVSAHHVEDWMGAVGQLRASARA